ncbi:hypothetical protein F2Q69_00029887 [Brassica cretica]|uniref:Uncharacterized protein n=1 Tax=Brassica cretica TaxID=69181 RepID=A0A8S9RX47_BRACR|nr:hypothetical protein F2Q69_00029887 [Brassica cretica]
MDVDRKLREELRMDSQRLHEEFHDDFLQVVKQEKLQEGYFEVESSMSFGGTHFCRSTPDFEHRSTDFNQNRSMTPTESTASSNVVSILTHEEFAARDPHPPSAVYVKIDRRSNTDVDRQKETTIYRQKETAIDLQPPEPIDRRAPLTYRMQMPKIDVARLNALRPLATTQTFR